MAENKNIQPGHEKYTFSYKKECNCKAFKNLEIFTGLIVPNLKQMRENNENIIHQ